jgi:hypothetical protein
MKILVKKVLLIISIFPLYCIFTSLKQCLQVIYEYFLDKLFHRTGMSWDALHASHHPPNLFSFFGLQRDEMKNMMQCNGQNRKAATNQTFQTGDEIFL